VTRLSEAKVLTAGVDVVRARGVEALGVRSVADRLGVTPLALYRYVRDGDELHASVIGLILAGLPRPGAAGAPADRMREWALAARAMLTRYPGLARYLLLRGFELEDALDGVEGLLGVAADAGLTGFECVAAANAVFTYVLMRVEAETSVRAARVVTRSLRPVRRDPQRYPLARRYESEFTTARFDDHFTFGLDALLQRVATKAVVG
jgi:AcrR family transcriptional regulator